MAQQAAHSCDLDAFFVSGDGAADFTDDEREEQQEKKERRAAEAKKRNQERQRTKEKLKTQQKVQSSTVTSTSASSTGWDDETPPTDLTHVTIQPPQPPALMAQQMPSKSPSPSVRSQARRNVALSNLPSPQQQSAFSTADAFPGPAPGGTRSTMSIPASARWGEGNQINWKTSETDAIKPNSDTTSIVSAAAISSGTAANVLPPTDGATAMTPITPSNDNSKDALTARTVSIVQSFERLHVAGHSKDAVDMHTGSHDVCSSQAPPVLSRNISRDTVPDKMATLLSNFGIQATPAHICLGIISAVQSSESVFIQLWHQRNDLQELSADLEAYYQANQSELLNENVLLESCVPLLFVLAPDDVYRCVVVSEAELRPFDDANTRSFNVFLVDHGCEVLASEAQLFALPDRFWLRPPFAFRCIFAEILESPKWRTGAYRFAFCHLLDTHYVKTELPVICQFQPRSVEAGENANSRQFAVQLYDTITDGCTVLQVLEQKGGL